MNKPPIIYIHGSPIPLFDQANNFHALNMCQAYQQEGYNVTLMATRPPDYPHAQLDLEEIWRRFDIDARFKLLTFRSLRPFHPYRYYDSAVRMAFKARQMANVRIHTRNITAALWGMMLGLPVIFELHGPPAGRLNKWQARRAFQHRNLLKIITNSNGLKQILLEEYGDILSSEQIQPEQNAIDLTRFEGLPDQATIRQNLGQSPDDFIVVYAGSMYAGRGVEILIKSAEFIPEVRFLLLGGEPHQVAEFRTQTAHLNNIDFLGHVSGREVPLYLKAADILVMPYQRQIAVANIGTENSADYASPIKLFEYLGAGRFIISSDLPVLHEVLDEKTAAFCTSDDVEEWVAIIKRAKENPTWRNALAQASLDKIQHYTWRKRIQRIHHDL